MGRHAGEGPTGHTRILVGVAFVALVIVAVGVVLGLRFGGDDPVPAAAPAPSTSPAPPPPPPPPAPGPANGLQESFREFQQQQFGGEIAGLVVMPIGGEPITVAPWNGEVFAWSTIKVPLSVTAIRNGLGAELAPDIAAALTVSDNDAAERIWAALGSGEEAASKVQAILDDPATVVQAERIRPPYTPFGQTKWLLDNQARFLSGLACQTDDAATQVLTLMGQVASDTWGLGRIPGTKFKGGWGPGAQSGYLVRQFGVLTDDSGAPTAVVAVVVEPGSFGEGQQDMNTIAQWLTDNRAQLPTGACPADQP